MTKILVIGDFHGKISKKVFQRIISEKPDLIFSPGDFCGNEELAKLFFKHAYARKDEEIPKKIVKRIEVLQEVAIRDGFKVLKKLRSLNIPFFAIRGNWDPTPYGHDLAIKVDRRDRKWFKRFQALQNEKFKFVDLDVLEFNDFVLVGGVASTAPLRLKKGLKERLIKKWFLSKKEAEEYVKIIKKNWNFRQKRFDENFKRALKLNKLIIFMTHNSPYNTKLDIIGHGSQKGQHYGSYQERLIIKNYKPHLVLCGHIHECFGKDKLGKSLIVNTGSIQDKHYATLEMVEGKIKNLRLKKI